MAYCSFHPENESKKATETFNGLAVCSRCARRLALLRNSGNVAAELQAALRLLHRITDARAPLAEVPLRVIYRGLSDVALDALLATTKDHRLCLTRCLASIEKGVREGVITDYYILRVGNLTLVRGGGSKQEHQFDHPCEEFILLEKRVPAKKATSRRARRRATEGRR